MRNIMQVRWCDLVRTPWNRRICSPRLTSSFWKSISLFLDVHKTLLARRNPYTTAMATIARNILRFPTSFLALSHEARVRLCQFYINTYQSFNASFRTMHIGLAARSASKFTVDLVLRFRRNRFLRWIFSP